MDRVTCRICHIHNLYTVSEKAAIFQTRHLTIHQYSQEYSTKKSWFDCFGPRCVIAKFAYYNINRRYGPGPPYLHPFSKSIHVCPALASDDFNILFTTQLCSNQRREVLKCTLRNTAVLRTGIQNHRGAAEAFCGYNITSKGFRDNWIRLKKHKTHSFSPGAT